MGPKILVPALKKSSNTKLIKNICLKLNEKVDQNIKTKSNISLILNVLKKIDMKKLRN